MGEEKWIRRKPGRVSGTVVPPPAEGDGPALPQRREPGRSRHRPDGSSHGRAQAKPPEMPDNVRPLFQPVLRRAKPWPAVIAATRWPSRRPDQLAAARHVRPRHARPIAARPGRGRPRRQTSLARAAVRSRRTGQQRTDGPTTGPQRAAALAARQPERFWLRALRGRQQRLATRAGPPGRLLASPPPGRLLASPPPMVGGPADLAAGMWPGWPP